jgi:endonuclease/exonuclease/phosphatase family metal-dependent hydrolase
LRRRIDYVFVRDATVAGARVVGDRQADRTASGLWPSDHAALVVDVALDVRPAADGIRAGRNSDQDA